MTSTSTAPAPDVRSETLRPWRGRHAGETIVVCGCGRSLRDLPEPGLWLTIGVNDVGRLFDPTYLVVVNPRSQFRGDRFRHVAASRARAVFTQLDPRRDLGGADLPFVRFRLGRRGGTVLDDPDSLPYTRNSPYVAACLAAFLGAKRIGLIGVDFTDHHFFADTGRHPLARELARIDREYAGLREAFARRGVELVNLSAESRLGALPRAAAASWLAGASARLTSTPAKRRESRAVRAVAVHPPRGHLLLDRCLDTLAATAAALGLPVSRNLAVARNRPDTVSIVWNGRQHRPIGPTLYCEHGWLPRSEYQISPRGINADSHAAPFRWDGEPLAAEEREALGRRLESVRRAEHDELEAPGLPEEFLLVPLQMEGDTNLVRHAPRELRRMQGLVDLVSRANPPWPLVFKQHPADLRRSPPRHPRLRLRRRQDLLYPHARGTVHGILATRRCVGIVSVNSNVVHDGLLWDVPAVVLGRNVWPRSGPSPFLDRLPADWLDLANHLEDPEVLRVREAYAAHLLRHQWTAAELKDPEVVRGLLAEAMRQGNPGPPAASRARARAASSRRRPMTVNVVARDRGWLFEDLKRHFVAASGPDRRVVASDRPRRDADRWIFLRTHEAAATPDPRRTVVQVHDLFDGGLYRPGGRRHRAVRRSGAVVLTHPGQREILAASGVPLDGRPVLCRPLGALSAFTLRRALPESFGVGWVGRPVVHDGTDVKREGWLVEALRRLAPSSPPDPPAPPIRALLVGERLEATAEALAGAGVEARYRHRRETPIEDYPGLYHQLDVLVVTSRMAAGPNSLFEALACGVPVVSTRAGWAETLLRPGENGYLVDSVDELAEALTEIRDHREAWFERRDAVRGSLRGLTLESWVEENLAAAAALPG